MRSKPSSLAAGGWFFAVALGLAWYTWREHSRLEDSLRALGQEQAAFSGRIHQAQDKVDAQKKKEAEVQAQIKDLHAAKAVAATVADSSSDQPKPKRESLAALLTSDPHLLDLYRKSFRLGLRPRFEATYRALGFTPAQIDKFEELATAHEIDNMDLQASAEAQGLTTADPGIVSMRQQSNQQFFDAASAVAGQNWQQFRDSTFGRVQALSGAVNYVAAQVAYNSQPMTSAQADQLTQILANTTAAYQRGGAATPNSIDWAAAATQAAGALSPDQVQAVKMLGSLNAIEHLVGEFNAAQSPPPPAN